MSLKRWSEVISRISPQTPTNLDHLLAPHDPRARPPAAYRFPTNSRASLFDTPFAKESTIAFGARVTHETSDRVALAMTLAEMAAEKMAEPIILSHLEYSGLERFGFRVERVCGATEEEIMAAEAELIAFWNIVLVI